MFSTGVSWSIGVEVSMLVSLLDLSPSREDASGDAAFSTEEVGAPMPITRSPELLPTCRFSLILFLTRVCLEGVLLVVVQDRLM